MLGGANLPEYSPVQSPCIPEIEDQPPIVEPFTSEQLQQFYSYRLKNIKLLDKITFVVGVMLMTICEYVVFARPNLMPMLYICLVVPLVTARYIVYRMNKWHYFLLDFCYSQNILLIITIIRAFVFKHDISTIFPTLFVLIDGVLLGAIPTWNNSLVFHDLIKLTSISIHFLPTLVTYCLRWHSDMNMPNELDWFTGFIYPFIIYTIWQIGYLIYTEIIKRDTIYNEGYMTSVRWLCEEKPHKIVMWAKDHIYPKSFSKLASLVITQYGFYFATTLPQFLMYKYKFIQTAWIMFCFVIAIWNGAKYYFDTFVNKYNGYLNQFKTSRKEKESETKEIVE